MFFGGTCTQTGNLEEAIQGRERQSARRTEVWLRASRHRRVPQLVLELQHLLFLRVRKIFRSLEQQEIMGHAVQFDPSADVFLETVLQPACLVSPKKV